MTSADLGRIEPAAHRISLCEMTSGLCARLNHATRPGLVGVDGSSWTSSCVPFGPLAVWGLTVVVEPLVSRDGAVGCPWPLTMPDGRNGGEPVASRGLLHGGFGEWSGETGQEQSRHRAPGRLNHGYRFAPVTGGMVTTGTCPGHNHALLARGGTTSEGQGLIPAHCCRAVPMLLNVSWLVPKRSAHICCSWAITAVGSGFGGTWFTVLNNAWSRFQVLLATTGIGAAQDGPVLAATPTLLPKYHSSPPATGGPGLMMVENPNP